MSGKCRKNIALQASSLRRVLAWTLSIAQLLYPALASAQAIIADGRTQTTVGTVGKVVNVTTGTVSGANAFNSPSRSY